MKRSGGDLPGGRESISLRRGDRRGIASSPVAGRGEGRAPWRLESRVFGPQDRGVGHA